MKTVTETIEITNDFTAISLIEVLRLLPPETKMNAWFDNVYENIYLTFERELTQEEIANNIAHETTLKNLREEAKRKERFAEYNDLKDSSIIQKWEELRKEFERMKTILKTGENYPCGPCELPLICSECGELITKDNVVSSTCEGECEICEFCGDEKCPNCGEHWHCGGCV